MKGDYELENRRYVIGGVAIAIVVIYLLRLLSLQILSDDYKKNADSNAFLKKVEFPARGVISDRNGKLMVYNQHSYDLMVVMNEEKDHLDTLEFCDALGITKEDFIKRMDEIKDRSKNPGYSRFTQQLFMSQLSEKEFSIFQEKMYRFLVSMCSAAVSVNMYIPMRPTCWAMWQKFRRRISRRMNITSLATISASWVWNGIMRNSCVARKVFRYCFVMPTGVSRENTRMVPSTVNL